MGLCWQQYEREGRNPITGEAAMSTRRRIQRQQIGFPLLRTATPNRRIPLQHLQVEFAIVKHRTGRERPQKREPLFLRTDVPHPKLRPVKIVNDCYYIMPEFFTQTDPIKFLLLINTK
jgi:hypothetical protein